LREFLADGIHSNAGTLLLATLVAGGTRFRAGMDFRETRDQERRDFAGSTQCVAE